MSKKKNLFLESSLRKLNIIISSLKENTNPNAEELKDEFHSLERILNQRISEVETYLARKEELSTSMLPVDVLERYKLNEKIEEDLKDIQVGLKQMETVLRSHKKRRKKFSLESLQHKEQKQRELHDRFFHARNKFEGIVVLDEEDIVDRRIEIKDTREERKAYYEHRELYEEERIAIENWNQQQTQQEEGLNELKTGVKELKTNVNVIGKEIEGIGIRTLECANRVKVIDKKLMTNNQKLKELLSRIRKGDKICVDILLFLTLLGLIAVLVGLIRRKF